jgi:hypothetical protein
MLGFLIFGKKFEYKQTIAKKFHQVLPIEL